MIKLAPVLLISSLALNAVLTVTLVLGARSNRPVIAAPAPVPTRTAASAAPAIDANVWPALVDGDLKAIVTRLRDSGFPPEIIRAIVTERLSEQFAARRKAIDPESESRPFWKSPVPDAEKMNAFRQLAREQQNALRELLGPEADLYDPMSVARDKRMFGHLAPEKANEARRLVREFTELRSDVIRGYGGPVMITTVEREKMNAIDRQLKTELMKIMTPQEFETYELLGSNTANSVRYQLSAFDPTETEFLAIYRLQRTFDDRFGQFMGQPSQEEMRQRSAAQQELTEQIKAALGPVRAEQYTRATDYEYRTTSQLVARLELPPETTDKAWSIKDDVQKRAMLLRQDSSLPPDDRTARMAALQQEASDRLASLFGARGVEAYKQYGGQWLDNMFPRPRADSAVRR